MSHLGLPGRAFLCHPSPVWTPHASAQCLWTAQHPEGGGHSPYTSYGALWAVQGDNGLMGVTGDMSQCQAKMTDVEESERDRKQQTEVQRDKKKTAIS